MIAVVVRVEGVVQGVGFRWFTAREAGRLGVAGWVRNLPDGAVEVHVEGPERAVDSMISWLADGPPAAEVDSVDVVETVVEGFGGFEIRR